MLRARGDRWEYLAIEVALRRTAPPALTPEQRERIRARIMAQLGAQEERSPVVFRTKWVAVPLGAGLAATIVAGVRLVADQYFGSRPDGAVVAGGRLLAGGRPVAELGEGEPAVARSDSSILFPAYGARFDAVAGSRFELVSSRDELAFRLFQGSFSAASDGTPLRLVGVGWSAVFASGGVTSVEIGQEAVRIAVFEGEATVMVGGGSCTAMPGDTVVVVGDSCIVLPGGNPEAPGQGGANPGAGAGSGSGGGNPEAPGQGGANPGAGAGSGNGGGNPEAPGQGGANPGAGAGSGNGGGNGGNANPRGRPNG